MRYETPRKDHTVATLLKILSLARLWGSPEVQILPDKFVLDLKATPSPSKDKTLADVMRRVRVVPARMSNSLLTDVQAISLLAARKAKYLTHVFVADRAKLFATLGLAPSSLLLGIRVESDDSLADDVVMFGLADVPGAPLQALTLIIKGEPND